MSDIKPKPIKSVLGRQWLWHDFGSGCELFSATGGSLCVLAGEDIRVRGDDGTLVPITPDHPVAKLTAASPDLYAACEEAENWIENTQDLDNDEGAVMLLGILRAAIARTTGEI